jgi:hypothetical protein
MLDEPEKTSLVQTLSLSSIAPSKKKDSIPVIKCYTTDAVSRQLASWYSGRILD